MKIRGYIGAQASIRLDNNSSPQNYIIQEKPVKQLFNSTNLIGSKCSTELSQGIDGVDYIELTESISSGNHTIETAKLNNRALRAVTAHQKNVQIFPVPGKAPKNSNDFTKIILEGKIIRTIKPSLASPSWNNTILFALSAIDKAIKPLRYFNLRSKTTLAFLKTKSPQKFSVINTTNSFTKTI